MIDQPLLYHVPMCLLHFYIISDSSSDEIFANFGDIHILWDMAVDVINSGLWVAKA